MNKDDRTRSICVYLGSRPGKSSFFAEKARELGRWIGESGFRLVYGGSRIGLMGVLAASAMDAGAKVTGVEPQFFVDSVLQMEGLDELIVTKDMSERKAKLIELSDAFIAFPGGTGTLEEISEIMSAVSLGLTDKPCILYDLDGFYDLLEAQLDRMVDEEFVTLENRAKIRFCRSLQEIGEVLRRL